MLPGLVGAGVAWNVQARREPLPPTIRSPRTGVFPGRRAVARTLSRRRRKLGLHVHGEAVTLDPWAESANLRIRGWMVRTS
jgi:hypothetical protein